VKPGGRADHPIELLSASIDRELRPAESAALETHLEACAECRGLLGDFRRLDKAIASEPVPPVPVGFEERILAELSRRPPVPARPFWRQALPLAAAASLVMAVLLWSERPDRLPGLSDSTPATATDALAPVPSLRGDAQESKAADADAANGPQLPGPAAASPPASPRKGLVARRQAKPLTKSAHPAPDQWKVESAPEPPAVAPEEMAGAKAQQEVAREEAARAVAAAEIQPAGKQKERLETDAAALALSLLPLCEGSPAPSSPRGSMGRAAAVAARPVSLPFALLAPPYAVRLEPDHRLRMERGDYACTVVIDDADGRTIAAALDESLRSTAASPVAAEQPMRPCLVTATPAAHQAVVRLIQDRYRGAFEKTCGVLPN
jgi:hypothetical protein